jgi:hypothetical protein
MATRKRHHNSRLAWKFRRFEPDREPVVCLKLLKASVRQKNVKNEAELRTVIQEAWESVSLQHIVRI